MGKRGAPNLQSESELMRRAVRSENLIQRSSANQQYGQNDFAGWVRQIIDGLEFAKVLDMCCGTGNQLIHYAARPEVSLLVGIDLSAESLQIAKRRLAKTGTRSAIKLIQIGMEDISGNQMISETQFDLISCFYGLYYSRDAHQTIEDAARQLAKGGTFLIAGPYGATNRTLYNILERHFPLPEAVVRSSSTFMEETVIPKLSSLMKVEQRTFVNRIRYPSADEVLNYWRASTFFSPTHEKSVERDIRKHFEQHGEFVIEKHVMAAVGRK